MNNSGVSGKKKSAKKKKKGDEEDFNNSLTQAIYQSIYSIYLSRVVKVLNLREGREQGVGTVLAV